MLDYIDGLKKNMIQKWYGLKRRKNIYNRPGTYVKIIINLVVHIVLYFNIYVLVKKKYRSI